MGDRSVDPGAKSDWKRTVYDILFCAIIAAAFGGIAFGLCLYLLSLLPIQGN